MFFHKKYILAMPRNRKRNELWNVLFKAKEIAAIGHERESMELLEPDGQNKRKRSTEMEG